MRWAIFFEKCMQDMHSIMAVYWNKSWWNPSKPFLFFKFGYLVGVGSFVKLRWRRDKNFVLKLVILRKFAEKIEKLSHFTIFINQESLIWLLLRRSYSKEWLFCRELRYLQTWKFIRALWNVDKRDQFVINHFYAKLWERKIEMYHYFRYSSQSFW